MRSQYARNRTRDIVSLGGWLFADLLLALAMLFFTTSIDIKPLHSVTPTPTIKVKPTVLPRLELNHQRAVFSIDAYGLLQGDSGAVSNVKQQVRALSYLHNRRAGLVIVYGSALDVTQVDTALTVAQKVYDVLRTLGKEGFVFKQASYYDPLYFLGRDINTVTIDIYLFAQ